MADLPMSYRTSYAWQGRAADGTVTIRQHPSLPVGTPHDAGRFSPEHLLVVTAETCLANYVLLIAERSELQILDYRSTTEGQLERDEDRLFRFKRILIRPELTVAAGSGPLALRVLEKAHRSCLVARSLNCPVDIEPKILA